MLPQSPASLCYSAGCSVGRAAFFGAIQKASGRSNRKFSRVPRVAHQIAIEPTTPARFEVIPDAAGVYPIRLIGADRRIGRLDISP